MEKKILVSIQCLVYNHESYLRQCLDGFVMQKTNFKFEAIVHDDCSTDGSAAIIREYAEKYPDIIKPIYETENQYSKHDGSLDRIMNSACKGKYIALCEGDDYWTDPLKLQKQYDVLENSHNVILVYTNYNVVDDKNNYLILAFWEKNKERSHSGDNFPDLVKGNYIMTLTTMFRRELLTNSLLKKCKNTMDLNYFRAASTMGDYSYIPEVTASYRRNPTGMTMSNHSIIDRNAKQINLFYNHFYLKSFYKKYKLCTRLKIKYFMIVDAFSLRYDKPFNIYKYYCGLDKTMFLFCPIALLYYIYKRIHKILIK